MNYTNNKGCNSVLDHVGATEFDNNCKVLAMDGSLVVYGLMGGSKIENFDYKKLLSKRANMSCTSLRSRSDDYKAKLVSEFTKNILPGFANESFKIIFDSKFDFSDEGIRAAHERMESNLNIGKILIEL